MLEEWLLEQFLRTSALAFSIQTTWTASSSSTHLLPQLAWVGPVGNVVPIGIGLIFTAGLR
jgi:hypothetical protein